MSQFWKLIKWVGPQNDGFPVVLLQKTEYVTTLKVFILSSVALVWRAQMGWNMEKSAWCSAPDNF